MGVTDFFRSVRDLPTGHRFIGFLTKSIESMLPQAKQQWALMLLSRYYPKSKVTKINIFYLPLFPLGVYLFIKSKQSMDNTRLDLMRRRKEIEDEVKEEIRLEKLNGTHRTFSEVQQDVRLETRVKEIWDLYKKKRSKKAAPETLDS